MATKKIWTTRVVRQSIQSGGVDTAGGLILQYVPQHRNPIHAWMSQRYLSPFHQHMLTHVYLHACLLYIINADLHACKLVYNHLFFRACMQ
jgi:hypothetical protein